MLLIDATKIMGASVAQKNLWPDMKVPGADTQTRGHTLSDWLTLHELDSIKCRRILDGMSVGAVGALAAHDGPDRVSQTIDLEEAWQRTVEAMRHFLPAHQSMIDDAFENTAKIVVSRGDNLRKAVTLDNGPTAYPTILFSYRGEPADVLIMAHEFGHALQIRASQQKLVPPILREICAFIGEGALLSYAKQSHPRQHSDLAQVWQKDNRRYLEVQRDRLKADLSKPATLYRYAWNYPIARYLAIRICECCSREWIWRLFEGKESVATILQELAARKPSAM